MDRSTSTNIINQSSFEGEELDLSTVFNFFNRNKIFFCKISFVFFILGFLYSFIPKKTWEGQFQIVVNLEKERNPLSISNPIIQNITGQAGGNLRTEVGILESPSVLMPVFEFKKSKQNNPNNNESFSNWKNGNLNIKLKKGTQILNIAYRDTDKEIILPVLDKMSKSYQKYSGISKKRFLENTRNYLEKQIEVYKVKSGSSLKKAQEFAIDQDLMYFDLKNNSLPVNPVKGKYDTSTFPNSPLAVQNINIENVRVQAANELKKIKLQIEKISKLDDFKDLQHIGSTIPSLVDAGLPQNLQSIDTQLVELRSKYTEQDLSIKRLKEKRKLTIDLLREKEINYLKAKKLEIESRMEAAMRPKGVLLKYKELIREADRDEKTLINLENQYRFNQLERSKQKVPWQLITRPTLLKYPVYPKKSSLIIVSVFIGLLLGTIYKIFKEKRSGNIFELKDIVKIKSFKFIEKFSLNNINSTKDQFFFLKEFINNESNDKVNLILLGEIKEEEIKTFKENLLKKIDKKLIISKNLEDIKGNAKFCTNFIISSLGYVNFSQIKILKNYEELMDINFQNLILLEK